MIQYSFIIPVKAVNAYIRETIQRILEIKRDDFEIIVYPDQADSEQWPKARQISSRSSSPGRKRNLSIKDAQGKILIFIDDDAYPEKIFLDLLDLDFQDQKIKAVGGPAVTPPEDQFWQRVSGAVFLSSLSGGCPERYQPLGRRRFVDDWPSVNFSVRKADFTALGGFDEQYWPGEDTKFCLDLIKKRKAKILYDPRLIVYHHRRRNLADHLKQVGNYGLHRGFFAKRFPKNSFKLKYFIPSLFFLFVFLGAGASIFSGLMLKLYIIGWFAYLLALIKASLDIYQFEKSILVILNALYYIFFTHLVYGMRFLQGFVLTKELKSRFR